MIGFSNATPRAEADDVRDVHDEGTAKTATCAARVFRFQATGSLPGADADGEVRLWVCESERRVARLEAKDRDGQRVVVEFDRTRRPVVTAP